MNIGIRPSANSMKTKRVVRLETSVCFRIIRLMNNQIKSQKELFPKKKRKRRQECCGYCENCTTIGLRLGLLGSIDFSKRKTVSVKPDAKSLGRQIYAKQIIVYLLSFQGYPPILEAFRPLFRPPQDSSSSSTSPESERSDGVAP